MTAVLVDSSVWIDYLRDRPTPQVLALDALLVVEEADVDGVLEGVLVPDLVLHEVLRGITDDRQHDRVRTNLLALRRVTLGGTENALAATHHYRALRRLGITIRKTVDCLIAAWCITHDVPLLHADRDYAPFVTHRGLRLFPDDGRNPAP